MQWQGTHGIADNVGVIRDELTHLSNRLHRPPEPPHLDRSVRESTPIPIKQAPMPAAVAPRPGSLTPPLFRHASVGSAMSREALLSSHHSDDILLMTPEWPLPHTIHPLRLLNDLLQGIKNKMDKFSTGQKDTPSMVLYPGPFPPPPITEFPLVQPSVAPLRTQIIEMGISHRPGPCCEFRSPECRCSPSPTRGEIAVALLRRLMHKFTISLLSLDMIANVDVATLGHLTMLQARCCHIAITIPITSFTTCCILHHLGNPSVT